MYSARILKQSTCIAPLLAFVLLSYIFTLSSVQSLSQVLLFATSWTAACQAFLCPSPTPGVYSKSCPLSQGCHETISSSLYPFSSRLQPFPASGSFQMNQLFASRGQSIGVSASASVLPINIQDWFPLGWTGWISLLSKGLSRVFSNTTALVCLCVPTPQFKSINSSVLSFLHSPTLISIHDYWKNHSFD